MAIKDSRHSASMGHDNLAMRCATTGKTKAIESVVISQHWITSNQQIGS